MCSTEFDADVISLVSFYLNELADACSVTSISLFKIYLII